MQMVKNNNIEKWYFASLWSWSTKNTNSLKNLFQNTFMPMVRRATLKVIKFLRRLLPPFFFYIVEILLILDRYFECGENVLAPERIYLIFTCLQKCCLVVKCSGYWEQSVFCTLLFVLCSYKWVSYKCRLVLFCFSRRLLFTTDPQWPSATLSGTLPNLTVHINEQKVGDTNNETSHHFSSVQLFTNELQGQNGLAVWTRLPLKTFGPRLCKFHKWLLVLLLFCKVWLSLLTSTYLAIYTWRPFTYNIIIELPVPFILN